MITALVLYFRCSLECDIPETNYRRDSRQRAWVGNDPHAQAGPGPARRHPSALAKSRCSYERPFLHSTDEKTEVQRPNAPRAHEALRPRARTEITFDCFYSNLLLWCNCYYCSYVRKMSSYLENARWSTERHLGVKCRNVWNFKWLSEREKSMYQTMWPIKMNSNLTTKYILDQCIKFYKVIT